MKLKLQKNEIFFYLLETMPREFSFRLIYIADKQCKTIHLRLILEQTFWITRPSWN